MAHDDLDLSARPDEALADSARGGDAAAFAELWRRHAGAGRVAARQFAHIADADDLLAEAFTRIFRALRGGGGPRGAFRPYLYRSIRNIALDWRRPPSLALDDAPDDELALPGPELAAAERTLGVRAFRSLPERWQTVLWYLEVEGLDPAEAAPILGLSPNATSALLTRAREGLKKAWLQAHVNESGVSDGCRWTTTRMGEYARGGLTRRGRERFAEHLATCQRCTTLLAEIEDAGGRLAVLLLPLLIGAPAAATLLAARRDGEASSTPGAGASGASALPATVVGVVAGVAALVVAGGLAAFALVPSSPSVSPADVSESAPDPSPDPTPAPTPTPTPTPTAAPPVPVPPRAVAPLPPVPPPPPVAPAAPAAPTVAFDPATGLLAATGSGDEPGATIELWGTTTSIITATTSPETLLASTTVAPDGSWTTPVAAGVTPINVTVFVRQVRDGVASAPVELFADAIFNAVAVSTTGTVVAGEATWQLQGWPGAAWEIREPGGGPTVAAGTFAADGTALASVPLPGVPSGTLLDYDYGYVAEGAMAASVPGLTVTTP